MYGVVVQADAVQVLNVLHEELRVEVLRPQVTLEHTARDHVASVVYEDSLLGGLRTLLDRSVLSVDVSEPAVETAVVTFQRCIVEHTAGLQVKLVFVVVVHRPFVSMVPTPVTVHRLKPTESHPLTQFPRLFHLVFVVLEHDELP